MNLDELRALREQIQNSPDQVTDEQLQAARDAIQTIRAENADLSQATPETVAMLRELVEVRTAVVGTQDSRAAAAAEVTAEAERLLIESGEPDPEPPADETTGDANDGVVDDEGTADPPAPPVEPAPELAGLAASISRSVAEGVAAAFRAQGGARPTGAAPQGRTGNPGGVNPAQVRTGRGDVATARVFLGSHSDQGRQLGSELELAREIHNRWRGAYQAARPGVRMPVLTVDVEYPESRTLGASVEDNFERIRAVTSPNALVAAGGLCAPLETLYEVEVLGSTSRPIRDALARFSVERGGIQFRPGLSAAAAVNGAGVWTLEDDEGAGGSGGAVKDCYVVDCPGIEEAVIQAIYSCLEFGNITTRFDPESTASNVQQGTIAHARLAERELYRLMAAEAKLVDGNTQVVGATRHILVEMDKLIAYYRDRHRLDDAVSLTWMAPQWVRDLMRADLAYQMAAGDWQDALGVAETMVAQWFSRRGITPVWFLDGATTQATVNGTVIPPQVYADLAVGGNIPAFPTSFDSLLYTTGSFLFLDGGSLDLGLVRDSDLNSRNSYQQFMETFEGIAFRGVEALRPVIAVKPSGGSSGTVAVSLS